MNQSPAPVEALEKALRRIVSITSATPAMNEQKLGLSMGIIQEVSEAALAALHPQPAPAVAVEAAWTLTAPDGRTFVGESPMRCAKAELDTRVPAEVQLARIWAGVEEARDELTSPLAQRVIDLHDKASMPWNQAGELALSEFGFDEEDLHELIGEYSQCLDYLMNRAEIEDFARHVLIFGPDYLPRAPLASILAARSAPAVAEKVPLTEEQLFRLIEKSGAPYRKPVQQTNRWTGEEETVYVETEEFSEFKFARLIERAHGIGPGSAQEGQANG